MVLISLKVYTKDQINHWKFIDISL